MGKYNLYRWYEKLLCPTCGSITTHEVEDNNQWRVYTCLECFGEYKEPARQRHHKLNRIKYDE